MNAGLWVLIAVVVLIAVAVVIVVVRMRQRSGTIIAARPPSATGDATKGGGDR